MQDLNRLVTTRLGILSPLEEEQAGLTSLMQGKCIEQIAGRAYVQGNLWGMDCVCVLSGIGKVAAASTTAILAERYRVSHILLTGVAGGAHPSIKIGDILVAEESIQHDMDARPLFPQYEIPMKGLSRFQSDTALTTSLIEACQDFIDSDFKTAISMEDRATFALHKPQVHRGLIGSGDLFVNSVDQLLRLTKRLPDLLAVEMEGAAVAQVCRDFGIPFASMRTVSDNANEQSAIDFVRFIQRVAAQYAIQVVRRLCTAGLAVAPD